MERRLFLKPFGGLLCLTLGLAWACSRHEFADDDDGAGGLGGGGGEQSSGGATVGSGGTGEGGADPDTGPLLDPWNEPGVVFWYDADHGVTATDALIATVADRSPVGNNAQAASAALTTFRNSKSAIYGGQIYRHGFVGGRTSGTVTWYAVGQWPSANASPTSALFDSFVFDEPARQSIYQNENNHVVGYNGITSDDTNLAPNFGEFFILRATFAATSSLSTITIIRDGKTTLEASFDPDDSSANGVSWGSLYVTDYFWVGARAQLALYEGFPASNGTILGFLEDYYDIHPAD